MTDPNEHLAHVAATLVASAAEIRQELEASGRAWQYLPADHAERAWLCTSFGGIAQLLRADGLPIRVTYAKHKGQDTIALTLNDRSPRG